MSDRLRSTSVPNEQVIDDLTKDLEFSLRDSDSQENVIHTDRNSADCDATGDRAETQSDNNLEAGEDTNQNDDESDTESIDDVTLKDEEVSLTDDQKEERRVNAEQLKVAGNQAFKVAEFEQSIEKYTEALKICPLQFTKLRSILFCNRGAACCKLEKYKRGIKDCTKSIELDENYLKAYHRRARMYQATDKLDECLADYKKILEIDPSHSEARAASVELPAAIERRNEELKKEMLGKLKDLGNMILRPFGLSTDNFQLQQDPESKGYKINFTQ